MRMDYRQALEAIGRAGFKYVELNPDVFPAGTISKEDVGEVRKLLNDYGLHPAAVLPLYPIASPDEEIRKDALEKWLRSIDSAKAVGAEMLTTEMTGDPTRPKEARDAFFRSMEVILPRLDDADFFLNFECHPGDFVENHYAAVDFIREINHPRFGYIYSVAHTYIMSDEKADIEEMVTYAGEDIKHVHCADGFKSFRFIQRPEYRCHMHLIPGQGEIDIRHTLRCLKKVNFTGYISLNLFAHIDHPASAIMMSRDQMRDYCEELGIELEF